MLGISCGKNKQQPAALCGICKFTTHRYNIWYMVWSPWLAATKQAIPAVELNAVEQAFCDELQLEKKFGRHTVVHKL